MKELKEKLDDIYCDFYFDVSNLIKEKDLPITDPLRFNFSKFPYSLEHFEYYHHQQLAYEKIRNMLLSLKVKSNDEKLLKKVKKTLEELEGLE